MRFLTILTILKDRAIRLCGWPVFGPTLWESSQEFFKHWDSAQLTGVAELAASEQLAQGWQSSAMHWVLLSFVKSPCEKKLHLERGDWLLEIRSTCWSSLVATVAAEVCVCPLPVESFLSVHLGHGNSTWLRCHGMTVIVSLSPCHVAFMLLSSPRVAVKGMETRAMLWPLMLATLTSSALKCSDQSHWRLELALQPSLEPTPTIPTSLINSRVQGTVKGPIQEYLWVSNQDPLEYFPNMKLVSVFKASIYQFIRSHQNKRITPG